jgi:serine phosphatase RsbU (regulator of sigma subunit)
MTATARWQERVVELMPGDALLFYTDGVTDTPSEDGRFGERRLLDALADRPEPASMIASVQGALRAFQVGDVVDDRAMLALQLVAVPTAGADAAETPQPDASMI